MYCRDYCRASPSYPMRYAHSFHSGEALWQFRFRPDLVRLVACSPVTSTNGRMFKSRGSSLGCRGRSRFRQAGKESLHNFRTWRTGPDADFSVDHVATKRHGSNVWRKRRGHLGQRRYRDAEAARHDGDDCVKVVDFQPFSRPLPARLWSTASPMREAFWLMLLRKRSCI